MSYGEKYNLFKPLTHAGGLHKHIPMMFMAAGYESFITANYCDAYRENILKEI